MGRKEAELVAELERRLRLVEEERDFFREQWTALAQLVKDEVLPHLREGSRMAARHGADWVGFVDLMLPHAQRGKKIIDDGTRGGHTKKGKLKRGRLTDEEMRAEVEARVARGESPTNARKLVARKAGLSPTTVARRTR